MFSTLYYIINIFFLLTTGNLTINWLFLSYATYRNERLSSPSHKDEGKREHFKNPNLQTVYYWIGKHLEMQPTAGYSKISVFHLFRELGKTCKYTQPKIYISNSKFWIYGCIRKTSLLKIRWGFHIKKDNHIINLTLMTEIFHFWNFKNLSMKWEKHFSFHF